MLHLYHTDDEVEQMRLTLKAIDDTQKEQEYFRSCIAKCEDVRIALGISQDELLRRAFKRSNLDDSSIVYASDLLYTGRSQLQAALRHALGNKLTADEDAIVQKIIDSAEKRAWTQAQERSAFSCAGR